MVRVSKLQGSAVLITHGGPFVRLKELEQAGCTRFVDTSVREVALSDLAQFINLLRTQAIDQPLSQALKDKACLAKALKERKSNRLWHSDAHQEGRQVAEVCKPSGTERRTPAASPQEEHRGRRVA